MPPGETFLGVFLIGKFSSRCNDEEVPLDFQEFSDDEQESKVLSITADDSRC